MSKCSTPAHFLILAPASVGALGLAGFTDPPDFGRGSRCIFGYALLMLFVLVSTSTGFRERPASFGAYWPYVFPTAALATCGVKYHDSQGSFLSGVLLWTLVGVNTSALVGVVCRELVVHNVHVCRRDAVWADPLFDTSTTPRSSPRQLSSIALRSAEKTSPSKQSNIVDIGGAPRDADWVPTSDSGDADLHTNKPDATIESGFLSLKLSAY